MSTAAELDDAFAAIAAERTVRQRHEHASRTLWRTHHWPEHYERCATIRGHLVCRRCSWMYSISFAVAFLGLVGVEPWPARLDGPLIWLLAAPATIEFVLGELTEVRYDARRQAAVTALLALAMGRGMAYELQEFGSPFFWGPVLSLGPLWFLAALIGWRRRTGQYA